MNECGEACWYKVEKGGSPEVPINFDLNDSMDECDH